MTFSTRDDAILHEIIEPIESGEATAAEYDIDAIADEVIGTYEQGYASQVEVAEFWEIVAKHAK